LSFERTLERHRKVVAAAEVEDVGRPHHALGDLLHLGGPCEHPLHQLREPGESAHDLAPLEDGKRAQSAILSVSSASAAIWLVNALVDATPISGPAWR